jgi:hypothetical protein
MQGTLFFRCIWSGPVLIKGYHYYVFFLILPAIYFLLNLYFDKVTFFEVVYSVRGKSQ